MTETKPGEDAPTGVNLPGGGILVPGSKKWSVTFYRTTMAELAAWLCKGSPGQPVQDHTGLTGRYDFALDGIGDPTDNPITFWRVESLGLSLVRIKVPVDTLVIDHIEKPSEN